MEILYHGTTVGWIDKSGFGAATVLSGELDTPASFSFLCSSRRGAEAAACKALTQVQHRLARGALSESSFQYQGVQYGIQPYIYEVELSTSAHVIDLRCNNLSLSNRLRLLDALEFLHADGPVLHRLRRLPRLLHLRWQPSAWLEILIEAAGERRNQLVHALGDAGFDLVKHIERDGDGQGYGEVHALPLSRAKCVHVRSKTVFERT